MSPADRPVLVAPDKFKGSLSADQVAGAIARGLARAGLFADTCRIADGGEGTIDAVRAELEDGGQITEVETVDPLGRPVSARLLELPGEAALIETAEAIGLDRLAGGEHDALGADSRGAGEMIAAAAEHGARHVYVGIGGTATTDGGAGAIELLRERGLVGRRGPLKRCPRITALCDVRAAWEQAATVFAPQKGASGDQVIELGQRLDLLAADLPLDPRGRLMTGAGGGLSGGLWACAGAELKSGASWVLDQLGFAPRMLAARAVITGEGALDRQTLLGKAVGEVATRARQSGVPCHAIVGRMAMSAFDARILDFETVVEATDLPGIELAAEALVPALALH